MIIGPPSGMIVSNIGLKGFSIDMYVFEYRKLDKLFILSNCHEVVGCWNTTNAKGPSLLLFIIVFLLWRKKSGMWKLVDNVLAIFHPLALFDRTLDHVSDILLSDHYDHRNFDHFLMWQHSFYLYNLSYSKYLSFTHTFDWWDKSLHDIMNSNFPKFFSN